MSFCYEYYYFCSKNKDVLSQLEANLKNSVYDDCKIEFEHGTAYLKEEYYYITFEAQGNDELVDLKKNKLLPICKKTSPEIKFVYIGWTSCGCGTWHYDPENIMFRNVDYYLDVEEPYPYDTCDPDHKMLYELSDSHDKYLTTEEFIKGLNAASLNEAMKKFENIQNKFEDEDIVMEIYPYDILTEPY